MQYDANVDFYDVSIAVGKSGNQETDKGPLVKKGDKIIEEQQKPVLAAQKKKSGSCWKKKQSAPAKVGEVQKTMGQQ